MAIDLLDPGVRLNVLDEINSEENKSRKREHQKRFDVYRNRQAEYILEKLCHEFSSKTVKDMRKILSLNMTEKIISNLASVYGQEPDREFSDANERELEQIENLYSFTDFDSKMSLANKYYKLFDQCALFLMPKNGIIETKVLPPFHYDVVPDPENPEVAMAYIMNVWSFDRDKSIRDNIPGSSLNSYKFNDMANQSIADDNDRQKAQERYVVWTKDFVYTMNGFGNIVNEDGPIANPIGRLPFIDIATEKDFQFFVRRGSGLVEFTLEFLAQLSDLANISRLQGYSQAIVYAQEQPQDMLIGPNHVLFMQLDPARPELAPRFEFASPSPDMAGAMQLLDAQLKIFLSSQGVDVSAINFTGDTKSFSSGVERFLHLVEKFEASRSDFSLFRGVEEDAFDIMRLWSNEMQGVTEGGLVPDLNVSRLSDNIDMTVKFHEPGIVRTQSEKEEATMKLLDAGLMSRKEAVMELRGVDETRAQEIIEEIDEVEIGEDRQGAEPDVSGEQPETEDQP